MAHVQSRSVVDATSATSTALAYSSAVTAGSILVALVEAGGSTATFSVSDSANGAWTALGSVQAAAGGMAGHVYQAFYKASAAAGSTTVTVNTSVTTSERSMVIGEYSGYGAVEASGYANKSTGTTTMQGATITPASGTDAVLSLGRIQVSGNSVAAPFTLRIGSGASGPVLADVLAPSGGTAYTPSYTLGSAGWDACFAAVVLSTSNPAPVNTVAPILTDMRTGLPPDGNVGESVAVSTGTWSNNPTGYSYQWQRDNSGGGTYSNISGATSTIYLLSPADIGCHVRCAVTATNASGSATANSGTVGPVAAFSRIIYSTVFNADQQTYVTVKADGYLDLFVRYDPASETGYFAEYESDTNNINVYRVNGLGQFSLITPGKTIGRALVSGDVVGLDATGTTLTTYLNGAVVQAVSDPAFNRAGQIGVGLGTGMTVDDFGGGATSSATVELVGAVSI